MTVNQRIKEVREFVGMTQTEFAKEIGKTQASITRNELGETKPRGTTLNSIIDKFNVSRHWLLTGDGEMFGVVAGTSESDLSTSWSEKAHDALKAHNEELKQQVTFLQDMLRKAMSGIGSENFQDDIALAAQKVKMTVLRGNIVRVAA